MTLLAEDEQQRGRDDEVEGEGEGVDTAEKYRLLKKLNFLILKVNAMRRASIANEIPERYAAQVVSRLEAGRQRK